MNFSKLNPKNWFRREEPPAPPRATGQPKYVPRQRCIVLRCPSFPGAVGREVVLIEAVDTYLCSDRRIQKAGWAWVTDQSSVFQPPRWGCPRLVFPEPNLLPIDDETINEELRNEVVDDLGTKKVEWDDVFKRLDKAIDELEESVKRRQAAKKQAI